MRTQNLSDLLAAVLDPRRRLNKRKTADAAEPAVRPRRYCLDQASTASANSASSRASSLTRSVNFRPSG